MFTSAKVKTLSGHFTKIVLQDFITRTKQLRPKSIADFFIQLDDFFANYTTRSVRP